MIKIMVDSASDCRDEALYDLFIPMTVNLCEKEYRDGVDLDNDTFYNLLTSGTEFPRTSQPSPEDFRQPFEKIKAAGDELIYFCLSSALSGTYQSATIAREMVDYDGIHIIDTRTATHLIGLLARFARERIAAGDTAQEIVEKCEALKGRIRVYAGVDTLEYLRRGGRIGKAAALLGTMANVKPLITVSREGEVEAAGKVLGIARAIQAIVDKVKADELDPAFPLCSLYTYGEENTERLEEKLTAAGYPVSARLQVGSTIGTHVGPGVYGVFYVTK